MSGVKEPSSGVNNKKNVDTKQQCNYNVTRRHVRATVVVVEKQLILII